MSKQVQFRRGTAEEHKNFIGANGEITVDTTNKTVRIHDGVTPGGASSMTLEMFENLTSGIIRALGYRFDEASGCFILDFGVMGDETK